MRALRAERAGRLNKKLLADRQHLSPGHPEVQRDVDDRDRERDVHDPFSKEDRDEAREQETGKRVQGVHDEDQHLIEAPAAVAGIQADGKSGEECHRDRDDHDDQRRPCSVQDARKHVPPDRVGAHQMPETLPFRGCTDVVQREVSRSRIRSVDDSNGQCISSEIRGVPTREPREIDPVEPVDGPNGDRRKPGRTRVSARFELIAAAVVAAAAPALRDELHVADDGLLVVRVPASA